MNIRLSWKTWSIILFRWAIRVITKWRSCPSSSCYSRLTRFKERSNRTKTHKIRAIFRRFRRLMTLCRQEGRPKLLIQSLKRAPSHRLVPKDIRDMQPSAPTPCLPILERNRDRQLLPASWRLVKKTKVWQARGSKTKILWHRHCFRHKIYHRIRLHLHLQTRSWHPNIMCSPSVRCILWIHLVTMMEQIMCRISATSWFRPFSRRRANQKRLSSREDVTIANRAETVARLNIQHHLTSTAPFLTSQISACSTSTQIHRHITTPWWFKTLKIVKITWSRLGM